MDKISDMSFEYFVINQAEKYLLIRKSKWELNKIENAFDDLIFKSCRMVLTQKVNK